MNQTEETTIKRLYEAEELIKKLQAQLGSSANADHKLWKETDDYCKQYNLSVIN